MAATSLRRSSMLMTLGSMSSRVLGVIRAALITAIVGFTVANDAFNVANTLPNVLFTLAAGGVLNAILVPQLVQATKRPDGGQDYTDRLLTVTITALLALTVILTVAAPWLVHLMAGKLQADKPGAYTLAIAFAYICLPQVFFYGLASLLGNILNARGHFVAYAWAPFVANVVAIAGLAGFMIAMPDPKLGGPWSPAMMWWFAGTATLSVAIQALFLVPALRRAGFRYRPRWGLRGAGLGATGRIASWAFLGIAISQIPYFVQNRVLLDAKTYDRPDFFVAGPSVPSAAYQIFMLPHAFVTVSIITAMYPRMSRWAADRRHRLLKRDFRRSMTMPIVANLPAMVLMIVLSRPLVGFLNPGIDDPVEIMTAGRVLAIMALAIVPFGLDLLNYRVFFALDDPKSPFATQVVWTVLGIGITLTAYLMRPQWAAYIYALSIVVSNFASWLTGLWLLRRKLGLLGLGTVARTAVRVAVATAIAGVVAYGTNLLADRLTVTLLDALRGVSHWIARPLSFGIQITLVGVVFAAVYVVLARALRIAEVNELTDLVLGRLTRRRRPAVQSAAD